MIRVWTSRTGEENSEKIFRRLSEHRRKRERAILVVPDQFTLAGDIRLAQALDVPAALEVSVMSFARLSREVLGTVGGIARPTITESGRSMMLRKVVEEEQAKLPLYASNLEREGFLQKLGTLLQELKRTKVSPDDLSVAGEECKDPMTAEKLREVSLIYSAVEERLDGRYMDSEDRLALLAEKLPEAKDLKDVHF